MCTRLEKSMPWCSWHLEFFACLTTNEFVGSPNVWDLLPLRFSVIVHFSKTVHCVTPLLDTMPSDLHISFSTLWVHTLEPRSSQPVGIEFLCPFLKIAQYVSRATEQYHNKNASRLGHDLALLHHDVRGRILAQTSASATLASLELLCEHEFPFWIPSQGSCYLSQSLMPRVWDFGAQ